jgi:polysaccharide pyruvyl transferase CsaB
VIAIGRTDLPAILRALAKTDLLVSGGGSLLQDVTGRWTIPYYLGIVCLALARRCPVLMYAQGIGPVTGRLGKALIRTVVNRMDWLTVRDPGSAALLRQLGVHAPPLEVTADAVFTLQPTDRGRGRAFLWQEVPVGGKPVIGVSVREWEAVSPRTLAKALDDLVAATGAVLLFIPMQYPADYEFSRLVASHMFNPARVMSQRLGTQDLLDLCSGLDMMVGMRLHSLIFAALGSVVPVGISYDPKIDAFLASLGLAPAAMANNLQPQEFVAQAWQIWQRRGELVGQLARRVGELRKRAEWNADLLVSLLPGEGR